MRALQQRCIVPAVLFVAASAVHAQATWQLPDGVEAGTVVPAALPEGMVGPVTFEESEFPLGTTVDGLVVATLDGIPLPAPLTFGFSSPDAIINGGPGDITYVQIPNIEGDASGTLAVDFGLDVTSLTFGFALACGAPVVDGAVAQALDASGAPVGSPVSIDALDFGSGFPENQLVLSPGGGFRSAEITFNSSGGCFRFAFDNVAYDGQPVPTLSTLGQALLALLLLASGCWVLALRRARV